MKWKNYNIFKFIFLYKLKEPKEDKDEELAKKVNESLNNPPKMIRSGGSNSSGLSDLTDALGQGNLQVDLSQTIFTNLSFCWI